MTLRELLERLPETRGKKPPGSGELRRNGEVLLRREIPMEGCPAVLTVYTCGFGLYECGGHYTVVPVRSGRRVRWEFAEGKAESLSCEDLLDEDWSLYLTLLGEHQLELAQEKKAERHVREMTEMTEEYDANFGYDPFAELSRENREEDFLYRYLQTLSPQQKKLVELRYGREMTVAEITACCGGAATSVRRSLRTILENAREQARAEGFRVPDGPIRLTKKT